MAVVTFSSVVLQRIRKAIVDQGLDADSILTRARYGLSLGSAGGGTERVSHNMASMLWEELEKESGDVSIGLHTGETLEFPSAMALEYLFLSSPTFGDALLTAEPYIRLVSDALHMSMQQDETSAMLIFRFSLDDTYGLRHLQEMCIAGFIRFFRSVSHNTFQPMSIGFTHSAPSQLEEYQRVFGCETLFDQPKTYIQFPIAMLEAPCPAPEPNIAEANVGVVERQLADLNNQDFLNRIKEVIGVLLIDGDVGLETVADILEIKPGRLRYVLSEQDTTFSDLVTEYRAALSQRLLTETEKSIDEIIYLTGFSEPSPFYRAFKRWTKMTPVAYRKKFRIDTL